jgi:serine-aspartate repeat-containing protein C/D/E
MIRSIHRSGLSRNAATAAVHQQVLCETRETRALFAATGTVTGTLWNDDNFDGQRQAFETLNPGRVVYIDGNHNGRIDSGEKKTTTNSQGVYTFSGLAAGSYDIKRVLPSTAYRVTTSTAPVTVSAGQTVTFGIGSTSQGEPTMPINGAITGVLFNDDNGSQTFDSYETVNPGRVVYLDANGNNKLDAGETSVVTDAYGRYAFLGLDAGSYRVRRVLPSGYHVTSVGATGNATVTVVAGKTTNQDIGSTARNDLA